MRKRTYFLSLTAEERRYIFHALLAYRNKLIAQGILFRAILSDNFLLE